MAVSTEPCNLHEVSNCSICTGLDKISNAKDRNIASAAEVAATAFLPTGYTRARHRGKCAGCGADVELDDVIRFSQSADGWVGLVCC